MRKIRILLLYILLISLCASNSVVVGAAQTAPVLPDTQATQATPVDSAQPSTSLERDQLNFQREQLAHQRRIDEARLGIERQRLRAEQRFTSKHFGTLITALLSLAAIVVSISQIVVAYLTKTRELELADIHKEAELEALATNHEREWNLKAVEFVATNRDLIFGEDRLLRERVSRVMLATFPPTITRALFERLEVASGGDTVDSAVWHAGKEAATRLLLVRTDGLYASLDENKGNKKTNFLRFFPDGTVMSATVVKAGPEDAQLIFRWLTPARSGLPRGNIELSESPEPGTFSVKGSEVRFTLELPAGKIHYRGTVQEGALAMNTHSEITGNESFNVYQFVSVPAV